jgi:8-oxo-dGTP pyrophosphatase MutT (NUDIX family)
LYRPHTFPISIKGVCVREDRVLLLHNERDEWELPGGKLELGEDPTTCLIREINEETGWNVRVGLILDAWQYHIGEGIDVLVITYGCFVDNQSPVRVSHEHKAAGLFFAEEIDGLVMPDGYRRSIKDWFTHIRSGVTG